MTKKRLAIGAGLLLVVGALFALWFSAPHIAKWYVLRNYSYIKSIDSIALHWKRAEVYGVYVEKENINAYIKYVHVNTEKNVEVIGGNITVQQQDGVSGSRGPAGPLSKGWKIKASELDVAVTAKGITANIHNVNYDEDKICFESGAATYKTVTGSFGKGCAWPEQKRGYVDKAETNLELPKTIPHIEKKHKVWAEKIRFDWEKKSVKILKLWVDDIIYVNQGVVFLDDQHVRGKALSVNFKHPWMGASLVSHLSVDVPRSLEGTITIRTSHMRGGEERVVQINVDPSNYNVWGEAQCADWMLALPHIDAIHDGGYSKMSGNFSFELGLKPPKIKLKNKCKIKCDFAPIAALRRKFSYQAIDSKGKPFKRVAGPYVPGWVHIESLPDHVPESFIRMEDPGFRGHRGVIRKALLVSLEMNLEAGKFVRGGSTITMQLVKNLWLDRYKTLDRKAAEIILSHMLEGCFSKNQILELYMNVVEFAPNVYGLRGGAWHYFQKTPQDLMPEESIYLARVLPNPRKARDPERGIDRTRKMIKLWQETGVLPESFGKIK